MSPYTPTVPTPRGALSTRGAAEYLDTTVGTLATWRCHGEGPPYVKLGRKVVYRLEALDAYLRERETPTTGGGRR